MLKVTNLKNFYALLVLLETFQIVRSSLPECNFFRNIVYIIVIIIKVENIREYICIIEANTREGKIYLYDTLITVDDPLPELHAKCELNESGIKFEKKSGKNKTQNVTYLKFSQSGNYEITLNYFLDNLLIFKLRDVDSTWLSRSIAIKLEIDNSLERYSQYILVESDLGRNIKKLSLKYASPNLLVNSNPIIATKKHPNENSVAVFFGTDLNEKIISFTSARQSVCNADNLKNAIANSPLDTNQIQDAIGRFGLTFYCLRYQRSDDITRTNDPCPETPNNPHYIQINPGDIQVAVYNSTWRSSLCYSIVYIFQIFNYFYT